MKHPFAVTLDSGSSLANLTGSWRTMRPVYVDRLPPCNHACPAGENIQAWLYHAESGDYENAWRVLTQGQSDARRDGAGLLSPLRERLQPGAGRRSGRHQFGRAFPRRRGDQARLALHAAGRGNRQARAGGRRRTVRAFRGLSSAPHGPCRFDLRCRARGRRHDALRHPQVPVAARRARCGSQADSRSRRRAQAQCQGRQYSRDDEGRPVRCGIPCRRRPYRQARLSSRRFRLKGPRRRHDAALDGRRGQAAARPARRRLRRRQHRDRCRAHGQAPRRDRSDHRLSPHPRSHAGARLRGRGGARRKAS